MKFKIDENLPTEIAGDLIKLGHEADTVYDENLSGAVDPQIMDQIRREGRALLTMDKGIANVRVYPPGDYAGLVLFRTKVAGRKSVLGFVRKNLDAIFKQDIRGRLLVISENNIRLR